MPRFPGPAVVGGADGRAVGLDLHDLSGEVNGVEVGRIAFHLHAVYAQVRQVSVLLRDVLRADLPGVLLPELAGIGPGLVDGGLAALVGEVAVAGEVHLRLGVHLVAGTQGISERAVVAARNAGDPEIGRGEPGKGEVALAVVAVLRGIETVAEMVDAHHDVVHGHRAQFVVFQFQGAGAGGEGMVLRIRVRHAGQDDASAGRAPLDAEEDFHTVEAQFRHLQPFPELEAAHLTVAVLVYLGPEPGQAAGKPVLADNDAFQEGHQEGHRFRMRLGEEL